MNTTLDTASIINSVSLVFVWLYVWGLRNRIVELENERDSYLAEAFEEDTFEKVKI